MLTSAEIAQLLAAQNNTFMAQRAYSQQVGVSTGSPYGGGGGGFQQGHGGAPAWSYAQGGIGGPGNAHGNAFAGGAMSLMGGAMTAGGLGLGAASMLGRMGAMAPLMDPFSGAAAGFRMGGLAGGLAGAALPIGIGMAAAHVGHAFIGGGQQQQQISNQLGQFQFQNSGARSGQGFSRDDAQSIGSSIRSLSHVPEMMTSVAELTSMLPKLKSMGVMQGVRDATEFAQRFKESVKTIRDVSKMLGTTMEEASEFFAHSRGVGFIGRQAQLQNTMNAQFTSGISGMTTGQVMQMQRGGADMAMSMGANRATGAKAVTGIAQQLALAQRGGTLKEGDLENITGLEGPEAIQAASQRFAGAIANMAQSTAIGRLSLFGMIKFDKNGKATGIDDDLAKQYRDGALSQNDLKKRAGSMTHAQKLSAVTRLPELAMDFAGKAGPQGIANFVENIAGDRFGSEGVNRILQMNSNLSASEIDVFQNSMGTGGGEDLFKSSALNQAKEAAIRDRTDPSAIMKRLKTRFHTATTGGIEEAGAKLFTEIGKSYDNFIDDLVGRHVIELSKQGAEGFARAMATGSARGELQKMFEATHRQGRSGGGGSASSLGEVGAFLRKGKFDTGRSAAYEEEYSKGLYDSASALDKGVSPFAGQGAAAAALEGIRNNIEGFRGMTEGAKRDEMRRGITARMESVFGSPQASAMFFEQLQHDPAGAMARLNNMGDTEGVGLIRAGIAGQKAFGAGTDFATAALAAGQSGMSSSSAFKVRFSDVAPAGAASSFNDIKAADAAVKSANESLNDLKLKSTTVQVLKDKPEMRRAIRLALMNDPAITEALNSRDDAAAMKALSDRGIKIKSEDLATLRDAVDDARSKGTTETLSAILTYEDARRFGDMTNIKQRGADLATELHEGARAHAGETNTSSVEALSAAVGAFASSPNDETFQAVRAGVGNVMKAAQAETDPGKRAALLKAAGQFGDMGGLISRGEKAIGRTMDAKGLAKALGVTFDSNVAAALAEAGVAGKTNLTRDIVERAEQGLAKVASGGKIAPTGATSVAGEKDTEIVKALKGFQTVTGLQTELLTMIVSGKVSEESKKAAADVLANAHETANAGRDGQTTN